MNNKCIFCDISKDKILFETEYWKCIYDAFPVSTGHILAILKRHEKNFFNLSKEELEDLNIRVIFKVKNIIDNKFNPDGYNIGVNIGKSGGQTINHCHIHIIPRYIGDCEDPTGGVRGVISNKQKY